MGQVTNIAMSINHILDRLRKYSCDLTNENEHDKAFVIDCAIETIKSLASNQKEASRDGTTG